MARVPLVDEDRVAEMLSGLNVGSGKHQVKVLNVFRVMAHRPELLAGFIGLYKAIWSAGVDRKIKEVAGLRAAFLNQCDY